MREGTITTADGRTLGYAEYGVPDGVPLIELHGVPGSRLFQLDDAALRAAGVRQVTVERPGFGLSDPSPGRTLLDWPADVEALADALGCDRFAVLGVSAGGPYALATAFALPDRVTVAGLACSLGPVFDHPQFDALLGPEHQALLPIAREDRETALALVRDFVSPTVERWAADPDAFFDEVFLAGWSEADRPRFVAERARWMANLAATYGRGVDTVVDEIGAGHGPWGFAPADLTVPVRAWHGTDDRSAPIELVRFVVEQARDGELVEYSGEGHYLDDAHHAAWLAALTAWAR